eukprot:351984-Chlamydomonas_euryale.AAC.1
MECRACARLRIGGRNRKGGWSGRFVAGGRLKSKHVGKGRKLTKAWGDWGKTHEDLENYKWDRTANWAPAYEASWAWACTAECAGGRARRQATGWAWACTAECAGGRARRKATDWAWACTAECAGGRARRQAADWAWACTAECAGG